MEQFMEITGADAETAKFYMDVANGDVERAITQYLESGSQPVTSSTSQQPQGQPQPQSQPQPEKPASPSPSQPSSRPFRFATLSDLDKEKDPEGQAYYAGGNKSGIQQIDPSKKRDADTKRMTDDVFKAAQKRGAQSYDEYQREQEKRTFKGRGYRLGHSSEEDLGAVKETENQEEAKAEIYFWKDGYSVDDGPLVSYTSPDGRRFMEQIQQGRVPRSLAEQYSFRDVTVVMKDHRGEEYRPPPKEFKAFKGQGRTLGSGGGSASASASSSVSTTAESKPAKPEHKVDDSKPTTSIQLRMHDGTRMVARFNLDDTVNDIRAFVAKATSTSSFKLLTTFPRKELSDNSATIEAAGLKNAVILQKLL